MSGVSCQVAGDYRVPLIPVNSIHIREWINSKRAKAEHNKGGGVDSSSLPESR